MDSPLARLAQKIVGSHVKKVRQGDQAGEVRLILALLIHLISTKAPEAQIFRCFRLGFSPAVPDLFEPSRKMLSFSFPPIDFRMIHSYNDNE